jgi:hypothetical protein
MEWTIIRLQTKIFKGIDLQSMTCLQTAEAVAKEQASKYSNTWRRISPDSSKYSAKNNQKYQ